MVGHHHHHHYPYHHFHRNDHQEDHQHDKITILTVVIIPKVVRVVGDRPRNGKSLGRSQIRPAPKFVIPFRPLSPSPPPQLPQMLNTYNCTIFLCSLDVGNIEEQFRCTGTEEKDHLAG